MDVRIVGKPWFEEFFVKATWSQTAIKLNRAEVEFVGLDSTVTIEVRVENAAGSNIGEGRVRESVEAGTVTAIVQSIVSTNDRSTVAC